MLLLLFIKEHLNEINRREFDALLFATLNTVFCFAKHEHFSIYMQIILAIISNTPGGLSFAKNLPTSDLLFYNNQNGSDNTTEERRSFIISFIFISLVHDRLEQNCLIHIGYGEDTLISFYDLNTNSSDEGDI